MCGGDSKKMLRRSRIQDADAGDADLHAGEKSGWFGRELERVPGTSAAGVRHLEQARAPRTHDSNLGHREDAVQQNEREQEEQVGEHVCLS
jgi:hypothetical protein